ncbi:biogenesis of lysosome-related organelles complex 1 subunit 5-like isoform X2 [Lycorma delicatula]|uniref:biogenesis of lysosome-related organelles complex 1 subunit 5-like isoform X2 n=1 Tax=Lycorma delicatula TaxID=130591 RepID=UPI003F518988
MSTVVKDCGEIWSRLFDHRPFLSGEIKFFLQEFEEKRSDREVQRLFEILEKVSEVRDSKIDRIKSATNSLPDLQTQIDLAVSRCETIIQNQNKYNSDLALEAKREIRKAEWEAFLIDIDEKYKKVDLTFGEKEKELREFYKDLERKLHINSD